MEIIQVLTEKEVEAINILVQTGSLKNRNCTITLHFSNSGTLNIVERRNTLFSAKHVNP